MAKSFTWERGLQSQLATAAAISFSYMCDILHRRKRASPEVARTIEREAKKLGIPLTRIDLLYPEESTSPAFHA